MNYKLKIVYRKKYSKNILFNDFYSILKYNFNKYFSEGSFPEDVRETLASVIVRTFSATIISNVRKLMAEGYSASGFEDKNIYKEIGRYLRDVFKTSKYTSLQYLADIFGKSLNKFDTKNKNYSNILNSAISHIINTLFNKKRYVRPKFIPITENTEAIETMEDSPTKQIELDVDSQILAIPTADISGFKTPFDTLNTINNDVAYFFSYAINHGNIEEISKKNVDDAIDAIIENNGLEINSDDLSKFKELYYNHIKKWQNIEK